MTDRTILVAVDFSPGSRKAFDAAVGLALDLKAKLVLVHALAPGLRRGRAKDSKGTATPEATEAVAWGQAARRAGLDVETVQRSGKPVDVILREAKRTAAQTVVVGSEGKSGLRKLFLGSVSQAVIQRSPIPVLVTPVRMGNASARKGKAGPILVAVDFSQDNEAAYQAGVRLARNLKAPLRLLHVVEIPFTNAAVPYTDAILSPQLIARDEEQAATEIAQLAAKAKRQRAKVEVSILVGHPASCITADAQASNAALVVVGTHGLGGARKFFLGSVAQGVVQIAHCPILVVPDGLAGDG